ncbi:sugar ABC transporter ATP-binding protein [Wenjunlia tyrosinilytica]|uniref:Sugar ABC transporter ATP-binding protein n=1 Tax=Wenjunlia tyrosinilytica TaxID=1544741 RepID=A0A917ZU61_9ACTN|nr:sugar ABC transporter ATP-binding protein [Wenjunlia tyrosinilytica]GGO91832.1 sugar ABC transporter ATP-binding protein [Wenjunlia tyrosinilytica]
MLTAHEQAVTAVQPLLDCRRLTKRFNSVTVVDGVDLALHGGEVHALLGENGAGKSTVIKMLAGVYRADDGEIQRRGVPLAIGEDLDIAFIHQDLGLVETLSVAENIALTVGYPRRAGLISWRAAARRAREVLDLLHAEIDVDEPVSSLAPGARSIVAIARALAQRRDVVVLDEPTATLPEEDVAALLAVLGRLRDQGVGALYVTHRLDEVFRIADRVSVLRDGQLVWQGRTADTDPDALVGAIVGRPLGEVFPRPEPPREQTLLALRDVRTPAAGPVSFRLRRAEVFGLAGLRGAGQEEIGRALFGLTALRGGTVEWEGREGCPGSVREALAQGIGFVSSNRAEESLAADLTAAENLFLNPRRRGAGALRPRPRAAERAAAKELIDRFRVRPADPDRPVQTFSGGNQQKLVLARWLSSPIRLLVLEEPTIGVDIGAKAEIYRLLREFTAAGNTVLVISSDFEEVAGICHRALVLNRGRAGRLLEGEQLTPATLIAAASHGPARTENSR